MSDKLYILHCSENASEAFLIPLERYFQGELIYLDETLSKPLPKKKDQVLIIVTDQFLKNKKCLDILQHPDAKKWQLFTIIYYHSSLNRVDKSYDVKSHGKIDLYYYKNFWERRYVHERKWIIDLGKEKNTEHEQYHFEIKQLKDNFGDIVDHLNSNAHAILENLKSRDYSALRNWLEGDQETSLSDLAGSDDIISRVPGLDTQSKEEDEEFDDTGNDINLSIESELLRKLVEFKKNQLGDSDIADEYIKEQLAKSQLELENEYRSQISHNDTVEEELSESVDDPDSFYVDSPIIIEDDVDEGHHLSKKDQFELESLLDQQIGIEPDHQLSNSPIESQEIGQDRMYYELALFHYNRGNQIQARKYYKLAKDLNPKLSNERNERAFKNEGPLSYDSVFEYNQQEKRKNNIPLSNHVMITGATSGIGKSTAEKFAEAGHDLIITGRRKKRLKKLSEEWSEKYGVEVITLKFDVRDFEQTSKAFQKIKEKNLVIDVLINNAGLASGLSKIQDGDIEDWNRMIDTNIKGLLHASRAALPLMIDRNQGHIVNIGSIAGKEVYPMGNVYNASKFAVEALTRAMRLDLSGHNIRVSQISPGHVEETEFAEVRFHGDKEKAKIYEDFNPVKSPDIAEIIYFVVTRPNHVNIQDVLVMGTQQASANLIDRSGREEDHP